MASTIVTTGIDATKPEFEDEFVSADIRNNFSAIKTQLDAAASDISALQTVDSAKQASDATLTALADFSAVGIMVHRGSDNFTARSLSAPSAGFTISNSDGTGGNPTFALANDLSGLENLTATGFATRVGTDTWTQRAIAVAVGLKVESPSGLTGNPTLSVDVDGTTIETAPASADKLLIWDASASTHRAMTRADFLTGNNPVGKHSIWIPARAWKARTTSGAASGSRELTANNMMIETFDFDAASAEYVQFPVRMPKSWDESTLSFDVDWTASTGAGDVVWELQALGLSNDDALSLTFGNSCAVADTFIAANDVHKTGESTACTAAGSLSAGDLVVFQLSRNAAAGTDTFTSDAQMIGVTVFATTDAGNDT